MGAVGLNFGSPTSGAGFDVSSTVASIVGNLQKVETPWKNQLAKLESQDTTLSSLGTLFSNLSNDISQLTDFQGILAQKTGSSSDTNVLQLTSASSVASAGAHSVVVNWLAQTSSGYLDPIIDQSDTLSGAVSIAINGETSHEFDLASLPVANQTLAGLSAAINAANIGVRASILTDAAGSRLNLVSSTSGDNGQLSVSSSLADTAMSSTANPTGGLSYHGTVDGKNASLNVDGVALSSQSNTVSNLISGVTFQLLAPSSPGSQVQVVIGNYNTGVESTVASMVSDYNALVSAINAQEENDSSGQPEALFGSPTLSLLQQQLMTGLTTQNPNGYMDAVVNASDILSGSISIQVGDGTLQKISLPTAGGTLSDLATAISSANIGVTANLVTSSGGTRLVLVSTTPGAKGALTVSSSISDSTTKTALAYNGSSSDLSGLTGLGISVNNDGSLTLDANSLDSLLNVDFTAVTGFFQDANSWGATFSKMLSNAGSSSANGVLSLAEKSNSTLESYLNSNISREESMISIQQQSLTAELNSANQILQAIPTQINTVNEIYSAITGYNSNRG